MATVARAISRNSDPPEGWVPVTSQPMVKPIRTAASTPRVATTHGVHEPPSPEPAAASASAAPVRAGRRASREPASTPAAYPAKLTAACRAREPE